MVILFDGYCGLCNKSVDWLLRKDSEQNLKFAAIQGEFAKRIPSSVLNVSNPNSLLVYVDGEVYQKSEAVILIIKKLPFPWKLLQIFFIVPTSVSDSVYDLISKNRYRWFGKSDVCRMPTPEEKTQFLD